MKIEIEVPKSYVNYVTKIRGWSEEDAKEFFQEALDMATEHIMDGDPNLNDQFKGAVHGFEEKKAYESSKE